LPAAADILAVVSVFDSDAPAAVCRWA
jgi:hypothetical protein